MSLQSSGCTLSCLYFSLYISFHKFPCIYTSIYFQSASESGSSSSTVSGEWLSRLLLLPFSPLLQSARLQWLTARPPDTNWPTPVETAVERHFLEKTQTQDHKGEKTKKNRGEKIFRGEEGWWWYVTSGSTYCTGIYLFHPLLFCHQCFQTVSSSIAFYSFNQREPKLAAVIFLWIA